MPMLVRQREDQASDGRGARSGLKRARVNCIEPADLVPVTDLTFAYVQRMFPLKGYSIALNDPSNESSVVHLHHSVANPLTLCEGQPVAFKVHRNPNGKAQACAPLWKLVGVIEEDAAIVWGSFVGVVKDGAPAGGVLIECREVTQAYGGDAHVSTEIVKDCGLQLGDIVRFSLERAAASTPRILSPLWKNCKGDEPLRLPNEDADVRELAPPLPPPPAPPAPQASIAHAAPVPPPPPAAPMASVPQETRAAAPVAPVAPGVPTAAPARGATHGLQPAPGSIGAPMEDQATTLVPKGSLGQAAGAGAANGPPPLPFLQGGASDVLEYKFGNVKATFPQQGYSLVSIAENDDPIFVHASLCDPNVLAEGQPVAFKFGVNPMGQGQASSPMWRLVGEIEEGSPVMWSELVGQVRGPTLLPNGAGVVNCQTVLDSYRQDAYIHESVVQACGLRPFDTIRFGLSVNEDGSNPQVLSPIWKECRTPDAHSDKGGAWSPAAPTGKGAPIGTEWLGPAPAGGDGWWSMKADAGDTKGKGGWPQSPMEWCKGWGNLDDWGQKGDSGDGGRDGWGCKGDGGIGGWGGNADGAADMWGIKGDAAKGNCVKGASTAWSTTWQPRA